MQQLRTVLNFVRNKERLAVRCPLNIPQLVQAFGMNDECGLTAQGVNFYWTIRASRESKTGAVRGEYAKQIIHQKVHIAIKVKSGQLSPASFDRVESRHGHLLVICRLLWDNTQV
jgi:hypothetical protein